MSSSPVAASFLGLKGMFKPIWANDISKHKAAVYAANFGLKHFKLGDIKI